MNDMSKNSSCLVEVVIKEEEHSDVEDCDSSRSPPNSANIKQEWEEMEIKKEYVDVTGGDQPIKTEDPEASKAKIEEGVKLEQPARSTSQLDGTRYSGEETGNQTQKQSNSLKELEVSQFFVKMDIDSTIRKSTKKRKSFGRLADVSKRLKIQSHTIGNDCKCKRFECFSNVKEEERNQIIKKFNEMSSYNEQNQYLSDLIIVMAIVRRRNRTNGSTAIFREASYSYRVRVLRDSEPHDVQVCRPAFIAIHGITKGRVEFITKSLKTSGAAPVDGRGRHTNRPRKLSEEKNSAIHEHINMFQGRQAHDTNKIYLSEELNVKKMHEMYKEKFPNLPVSYETYRSIFVKDFNICFGYPTSDESNSKLIALENEIKKGNTLASAGLHKLQVETKLHPAEADSFYNQKRKAKVFSRKEPDTDARAFDYQQGEIDQQSGAIEEDVEEFIRIEQLEQFLTPSLETSSRSDTANYVTLSDLQTNLKVSLITDFKCLICNKYFSSTKNLKSHIFTHKNEKPFSCEYCTKCFTRKSTLKSHLLTHGNNALKCEICMKTFSRQTNLKAHMFSHNTEKPFKCTQCDKSFGLKHYLESHMTTHTPTDKPFLCFVCFKSFSRERCLKRHINTHTGQSEKKRKKEIDSDISTQKSEHVSATGSNLTEADSHITQKSENVSTTVSNLIIETDSHITPIIKKPFNCDNCNKAFPRKATLRSHMFTHTGERPFKCEICEKAFGNSANLKDHMVTHSNERKFKCHLCEKAFRKKQHLKSHMATHKDEKPFNCEFCSKCFKRKGDMQSHMSSHGNNALKCVICSKFFSRKGNLKTHMLSHNTVKPFKCTQCDKSFSLKHYLESHMTIHTPIDKLFKCFACGKTFSRERCMKRHINTHHLTNVIGNVGADVVCID